MIAMNKSLSTSASRTLLLLAVLISSIVSQAFGHGVASGDQAYLMQVEGVNTFPFMYLGAKHIVTGYDHLLYLACVIFFLQNLKDVIKFVSLFALGHSITLLFGVLSGIHINAYFIDAIIGLSICYKALENLGAIRFLDPRLAVFGFGLAHGFGLSSKLQDLALSGNGLISNMIYFNIGVEIGQIIALTFLFLLFSWLRTLKRFSKIAINANVLLLAAGLVLFGLQATGFLIT